MAMWTYSQPIAQRSTPLRSRRRGLGLRVTPVIRLPAPPWMRPSFLTSMWIISPGPLTLIPLHGFQAEAAELAHPDPLEHPGDRRHRQVQQLGELGRK